MFLCVIQSEEAAARFPSFVIMLGLADLKLLFPTT